MNNVQIFGLVMLTLTVVVFIGGLFLIKRNVKSKAGPEHISFEKSNG